MPTNTPNRILEYLQKHASANAPELARALGQTVQNIRHHLVALQARGQVEPANLGQPSRPGRPSIYFRISSKSRAGDLEPFVNGLLAALLSGGAADQVPAWLYQTASQIAGEGFQSIRNPSQRLNRAVRRLSELGYSSRWEARPEGPRIFIHHSPFSFLYNQYPALCSLDQLIIEAMTGYSLVPHPTQHTDRGKAGARAYSISIR